jgi:hypothetical protein
VVRGLIDRQVDRSDEGEGFYFVMRKRLEQFGGWMGAG